MSEKIALLSQKSIKYVFVDFRPPYWCTSDVHQYGVSIQSSIKLCETFGVPHRPETWSCSCIRLLYHFIFLASFSERFQINCLWRDSENDLFRGLILATTLWFEVLAGFHFCYVYFSSISKTEKCYEFSSS